MTKNEYLITLATKLQKLTDDPRKIYPEIKSMIEFYQEMLDDKIEDGMMEEEAVAAMESPDEIAERLKREFGERAVEESAPEAPVQPAENSRAMRREYNPDKVNKVRVIDGDHRVKLLRGAQVAVNYEDDPNGKYEVSLENGVLTLKYIAEKRSFFRSIFGWRQKQQEVTVELPDGWAGTADISTMNVSIYASVAIDELLLHTSNGAIVLDDVRAGRISGSTTNGAIKIEDVNFEDMELGTYNGRIVVNGICGSMAKLTSSNATANVQDATVNDLLIKSSNGGLRIENVTGEKLYAQTSNGSIKVSGVNVSDVTLKSSNGSITGDICGDITDYAIVSKTSNGKNNLPDGTEGARKLDVRTSNASIAIEFVKKVNSEE
ncbi:MAG: DUF4097 family beta strand repeat protein [Clostridia bacterium]|nr:DUF4097 family beta strand repeat protein [Clostridia bacterium]